jgi:hypothetical protein
VSVPFQETTNVPGQHSRQLPSAIYTFAAAAKLLGRHPTTLFRQARDGTLRTVYTPVGRRIHIDELRRQSGEEIAE